MDDFESDVAFDDVGEEPGVEYPEDAFGEFEQGAPEDGWLDAAFEDRYETDGDF